MQSLALVLALLFTPVFAQEEPTAPAPAEQAEALGSPAPATVLNHQVNVTVDSALRLRTHVIWEVRIDDPEACQAGLLAPDGLDGAQDRGGMVLDDLFLVPTSVVAGTVYRLEQRSTGEHRGSQSGVLLTAPDLPAERVQFTVNSPWSQPLHLWHDAAGAPDHRGSSSRTIEVQWEDLTADQLGEVVWSTWPDWLEAGTTTEATVKRLQTDKEGLGRVLAEGYSGLHVAEASERINKHIALEEGNIDWTQARPALETIQAKSGSAVDRGVVLMSLLTLAGYDSEPGYYRPAGRRGGFPVTVPAPAMLGRPMIVVHREKGDVYIDPGASHVAVPTPPAAMAGGAIWLPGDLPAQLSTTDTTDGVVTINATLNVRLDGSANWTADVQASGTAEEWIRTLLASLDGDGRTEALRRLAISGRPDLKRFTASTVGVEKTRKKLKLSISGFDEKLLQPFGAGFRGNLPPVLAPGLAAWLPPNVRIIETLAVVTPAATGTLALTAPPSGLSPSALLSTELRQQTNRVSVVTTVERPYRVSTAALDSEAQRFLTSEVTHGPEIVLHATPDKDSIKALRATPSLDPAHAAVLEAMLWWRQRIAPKTSKAFRTGLKATSGKALSDALVYYGGLNSNRPWILLLDEVQDHGTTDDVVAVIQGMSQAGLHREAWTTAAPLGQDETLDTSLRVDLILLQYAFQGDEPEDPKYVGLWRPPEGLLDQAQGLAGPGDPRVVLARATKALKDGKPEEANALLSTVTVTDQTPGLAVLSARVAGAAGLPVDEAMKRAKRAMNAAPGDASVAASSAGLASDLGLLQEAASLGLMAARLAPSIPDHWDALVPVALDAGELPLAFMAARTASDLRPNDASRAETLGLVSAMLLDKQGWDLARARHAEVVPMVTNWPPTLEQIVALAPPEALLAVLQQHDRAVIENARLLAIRAQIRLDSGLSDQAARDGILLAIRHGKPDGWAMAWAATAGRMYSTTGRKNLDKAAKASLSARSTRMEVALISGDADPTVDARAISDDPRAAVIARLRTEPKAVAAEVNGWPLDLRNPSQKAPPGYRHNRWLSAAPGVVALSNKESGSTILRAASVTGLLPPPLHQMYSPAEQALAIIGESGRLIRLEGGVMPIFAAIDVDGDQEVIGLAFSPEAAVRALELATQ